MLREEVQTYKDTAVANKLIIEESEDVIRRKNSACSTCTQTGEINAVVVQAAEVAGDVNTEEDEVDPSVLVRNKHSGGRRSTPAADPEVQVVKVVKGKTKVDKKSKVKLSMTTCDICSADLKTLPELREHLKKSHDKEKEGGTMEYCQYCQYSALNKHHLNVHMKSCFTLANLTENRSKGNSQKKAQDRQSKGKVSRCYFRTERNCSENSGRVKCKFQHEEIKPCRFNDRCRDQKNCRFKHDKPQPNKPTQPKQFKKSRQNNQFNFQQNQGPAGQPQPHQFYNNHNAWQQHYNAWQQQNYNNYNPWAMPGVMQQNYNEAFPFLGAPLVNRRRMGA